VTTLDTDQLLAFLVVSTILLITPGLDMALVTQHALRYDRRTAITTSIGINCGVMIWAVATAIGIASVLRTSAHIFTAIKLLGAAYLVFLGAQALWASWRGEQNGRLSFSVAADQVSGTTLPTWSAFRRGVLSNLLNPKIAVFFTSLIPQFVDPSGSALKQSLLMGGIYVVQSVLWLFVFALIASKAATVLRRPRVKTTLERVTAGVLIAFGLRLATERS
jgi:RhtB (resistance to homoserine/threonine) family protein